MAEAGLGRRDAQSDDVCTVEAGLGAKARHGHSDDEGRGSQRARRAQNGNDRCKSRESTPSMMGLYFDQVEMGRVDELGAYEFTREVVLKFARAYDPQSFHVSDEAAAKSHFGR